MGTEIQGKACFLGSHRRNDLNESAGGNNVMFIYPDHRTVSQHYDSFLARPKNGYLAYHSGNKEELKKTILKHESIFKQQLEELHRLYRRHMDLMNDIKKSQQQQQKPHFPAQRSLLFSQIPYDDDDFNRKSRVSAISFVGSRDQMTSSTILNFHQGKHDMNIIIPGKALNLEFPADVEAKMQIESSSSYNGFTKPERFLERRTSCEFFDLNQPFQEAVLNSTNLSTSLLVEPSKTNIVGSEQVQKSRIFGVDISKGNYEDQTHKGNNSESTTFSSPLNKEKNGSNQTEMADTNHIVGAIDQSQKTSTNQPEVKNLAITNILGRRHDHIDLNLGVNELEDDFHAPYLKPAETIDLEQDPQCKLTDPNIRKEDEELLRAAAEAIVDISSIVDDQILTSLPCETLDWFAEIACSNHGHGNSTFGEEVENINSLNGMDYFEFVTLNLTEMKSDEWCHDKKPVLDNHEMNGKEVVEEEGLGRRLRRRRRGGRQRKDFQRDVLPGIVSLSRCEVSEDILAFEELLKTDRRNRQSNVVERRREERTSLLLLPGWGRRTKRISRLRCIATTSKS